MTKKQIILLCATIAMLWLPSSGFTWAASSIDSLKTLVGTAKHDSTAVRLYTQIADEFFMQKQNDSALYYYNLALTRVKPQFEQIYNPDIYFKIFQVFHNIGNYASSIEYLYKTLRYYDDLQNASHDTSAVRLKVAQIYIAVGVSHFSMKNFQKALYYFEYGQNLINSMSLNSDNPDLARLLFIFNLNRGSINVELNQFEEARKYYNDALLLNQLIGIEEYNAVLYNNLGIIYKEEGEYDKAHELYMKALEIRTVLKDTAGMAQVYNNLGNLEMTFNSYTKAIDYLKLSLDYSKKSGNKKSEILSLDILSQTFEKAGNHQKALETYKQFKHLHDSIISKEQLEQTTHLELQYQFEKQRKELELEQEIVLAQKEKKSLIYLTVAGFLLLSLIIFHLYNSNKRSKIEQANQRLELEQKNLNLENSNLKLTKEKLELELDYKNKELATHVMYLLQKNQYLTSISKELLEFKDRLIPKNQPQMQSIIQSLKSNIDDTVWEEFEMRFQNVQQDFYQRLHEKYPDLTPNEIKLCAFLKLNMTTKEISSITQQSPESIHVARSRLRKKMGIGRDMNLISLLQEI